MQIWFGLVCRKSAIVPISRLHCHHVIYSTAHRNHWWNHWMKMMKMLDTLYGCFQRKNNLFFVRLFCQQAKNLSRWWITVINVAFAYCSAFMHRHSIIAILYSLALWMKGSRFHHSKYVRIACAIYPIPYIRRLMNKSFEKNLKIMILSKCKPFIKNTRRMFGKNFNHLTWLVRSEISAKCGPPIYFHTNNAYRFGNRTLYIKN